ncbi:arginine--tRNA ligase [endosymbiont GvMRE of Glomus versiforme]|uniref:arginine--tRNA ligase n=1 Tax=endosymbiont GvMRE of Glomus versiforme TaxID=2039283 RepID=UPI000EE31870|nr:arginine--tRNA ligase [endosymbiont GvMRE of Glomus versiforme]RHZ37472.1 Arginine--tRNA ligase [endosymbiont GvMRE of Glomus versiforme]
MNKDNIINSLIAQWKIYASQNGLKWNHSFLQWNLPPAIKADFALNLALPMVHKTNQSAKTIAEKILYLTKDNKYLQGEITLQGYINFRLTDEYYYQFLKKIVIDDSFSGEKFGLSARSESSVLLEYVSANPTGYLHLAHFRHAVIGNTLANVYKFLGYQVIREYYINDRGGQITSLINSVYYFYHHLQGISPSIELEKIEYAGKSSQETAQKLIKKWGNKYTNKKLSNEEFNVWKKEVLELILAQICQDLEKCGIKFDNWFSETSLYEKNQHQELLAELKKKNLIYTQDGATFFRSSLGGDDKDRVIIKQDDDYTYFFSDIFYHLDKLKRADKLINIMGADHHGYISRIKSACQLLGYKPENIQTVLVQIVNLLTREGQTERFSKRAGNTIELEETLKHMEMDQLKFFLLEKETNQPLAINIELLKENKEKTRLYYIQYAHARCHQLLMKAKDKKINLSHENLNLTWDQEERNILKNLLRFSFILQLIIEENKPHHLIYYLGDLAQVFQTYYQKEIIIEVKDPLKTQQKLFLVQGVKEVLKTGLKLIGIIAPERM